MPRHAFIYLHGGYPVYLDTEYREIMRSVAKEYDIRIVDIGSALCHENI